MSRNIGHSFEDGFIPEIRIHLKYLGYNHGEHPGSVSSYVQNILALCGDHDRQSAYMRARKFFASAYKQSADTIDMLQGVYSDLHSEQWKALDALINSLQGASPRLDTIHFGRECPEWCEYAVVMRFKKWEIKKYALRDDMYFQIISVNGQ